MSSHRRGVAIAAVIIVVIIVGAVFVFANPLQPHFGFVSQSQASSATKQDYSQTSNSSSSTTAHDSGAKASQSKDYNSSSGAFLYIGITQYVNSSAALSAYDNIAADVGPFQINQNLNITGNGSYKGFNYEYVNIHVLIINWFVVVGHDGEYIFVMVGDSQISNGNLTVLAQDQVNSMVYI